MPNARSISTLPVRSFITSVATGATLLLDRVVELKGIAFDGGSGIKSVEVSIDEGRTWRSAELGSNLGRFSFREWRIPVKLARSGWSRLSRGRREVRGGSGCTGESGHLDPPWRGREMAQRAHAPMSGLTDAQINALAAYVLKQ